MTRLLLGGLLAAGGVAAYALLLEPNWLRVRSREVRVRRLPANLDGVVIAHISDPHVAASGDTSVVERAVCAVNAARPDLVVLTGDITRSGREAGRAADVLSALTVRPAMAVLGNHDFHFGERGATAIKRQLGDIGLPVLRDETACVEVRDSEIEVVGVDVTSDHGTSGLRRVVDALPASPRLRILLTHSPSALGALTPGDADLVLVGHTHGGQVYVPGLTWFYHRRFYLGLGDGLRERAGVPVHISRGLATAKLRARFLRRPEVSLLRLRAGSNPTCE